MSERFKGVNVLVVDDQESFREAVAFEFEMLGASPISAEDGQQAMEIFKARQIDLVVSDIRMPNWDGGKLLDEIRKVAPSGPPLILMTGFADLASYEAFERGCDAFLGKPLNPEDLPDIVDRLLRPIESRWTSAPNGIPAKVSELVCASQGKHVIELGRSGVFVPASLIGEGAQLKLNTPVRFDLELGLTSLVRLQGTGRVAWVRDADSEGLAAGVGIEFLHLADACRSEVTQYIAEQNTIATIPIGRVNTD